MDANSIPSLLQAEKLAHLPARPTQGGYNRNGVSASGGTHDGGAVVDLSVVGWSHNQRVRMVLWMRKCGWAAWLRSPTQGNWPWHIHGVRIGDLSASQVARAQVISYRNGRNGLASRVRDDGPHTFYTTWEASPYNPRNQKPGKVRMKVIRGPLQGLTANRNPKGAKYLRSVGFQMSGIRVKRWGRWNLMTSWETFYAIKDPDGTPRYLDYVKEK